jgi:hypothetical protein
MSSGGELYETALSAPVSYLSANCAIHRSGATNPSLDASCLSVNVSTPKVD